MSEYNAERIRAELNRLDESHNKEVRKMSMDEVKTAMNGRFGKEAQVTPFAGYFNKYDAVQMVKRLDEYLTEAIKKDKHDDVMRQLDKKTLKEIESLRYDIERL